MSTRITGGEHTGRSIQAAKQPGLRPTSEKVRAALFSIIGREAVEGARVLDLYAGTGVLGIEALSRGARSADFVERHPRRCGQIRESLRRMGLDDRGRVFRASVESALDRLQDKYDLVLADPPYDQEPWQWLINELDSRRMLAERGLLVAEHRPGTTLAEGYGNVSRVTTRRYGDTSISIYEAAAPDG